MFRRNDQRLSPKGETLPWEMRLFRYDLVESFLQAGIPISKIDSLRPFLQKYGHRLTSRGAFIRNNPTSHEKREINIEK